MAQAAEGVTGPALTGPTPGTPMTAQSPPTCAREGLGFRRCDGACLDGSHSRDIHDGAVTAHVGKGALVAVAEGLHPVWQLHARLDASFQHLGKELPLCGNKLGSSPPQIACMRLNGQGSLPKGMCHNEWKLQPRWSDSKRLMRMAHEQPAFVNVLPVP